MNWGEIRTKTRQRLGDSDGRIWSDSELLSYGNETLDDLTIHAKATIKRVQFTLTSGTRRYSLPTDYHEILGARVNGKKIYGTSSTELEEFDPQYLNRTGLTEWFYMEDSRSIAFHKIPSWTDDFTVATFSSENGEADRMVEGTTAWTFTQEDGVVIDVIDSTEARQFIMSDWNGLVVALDDGPLNVELAYIYRPTSFVNDADTPDLKTWMHWALIYGVLSQAFKRQGQGKNPTLMKWYGDRYMEYRKDWYRKNEIWSHGQAQFFSQRPVRVGTDQDWKMRLGGFRG